MRLLIVRSLRRSWRRWRTRELSWGTNYERFWPQLAIWQPDSLIFWIVTQHARKRRSMMGFMNDPAWAHIRFVRLSSTSDIDAFVEKLEQGDRLLGGGGRPGGSIDEFFPS